MLWLYRYFFPLHVEFRNCLFAQYLPFCWCVCLIPYRCENSTKYIFFLVLNKSIFGKKILEKEKIFTCLHKNRIRLQDMSLMKTFTVCIGVLHLIILFLFFIFSYKCIVKVLFWRQIFIFSYQCIIKKVMFEIRFSKLRFFNYYTFLFSYSGI